ncbi:hypothetical protein [Streptomyces sp. ADI95-17]|uniref:hypothetical protein n=1 Tax=Streptomyces sp. ADI95-17 TaxID=1522759 RepID=UPI000FA482B2|nr:hypothetical protein [Streptomyces sp. ADI95-17]RPK55920.1 hypothetical protein EES42_41490 [Streptomyces sp. ADI95-17]
MSIMATPLQAQASDIDEIHREDESSGHNGSGYERDETDQFHQIVGHLVTDGDHRARSAGRCARRTLAEMVPGHERQLVLLLTRPLTFQSADDACAICGFWKCICGFPSVSDRTVIR